MANLRVGSTPRIRRRSGEWVDGQTSWFSVTCWRGLGKNVGDPIKRGDAVVVHGRLRTDVWEREDGQSSVTYVVDATYVGHDLNRGTAVFVKAQRPDRNDPEEETDHVVKELLHEPGGELPQLTSFGEQRSEPGRVA